MKTTVIESDIFVKSLDVISKFVEKANFCFTENGLRIRSIDEDDFCYVDITLKKVIFENYPFLQKEFSIDISKFSRLLPKLSRASLLNLEVRDSYIELGIENNLKMAFQVKYLTESYYGSLPEPREIKFDAFVKIESKEFTDLVNTAAAISKELLFTIKQKHFMITAVGGDYSFTGKRIQEIDLPKDIGEISACTLASYLNTIGSLISKCDFVGLWLGNDKPVKLELTYEDKAVFTFYISHKRIKKASEISMDRNGTSLPRLTVTRLPEFLLYLANCPQGEETRFLREAGLETEAGDYSRMAHKLGFIEKFEGKIKLSKSGDIFVNLLQKDPQQAKSFLNNIAVSKIHSYKTMINTLEATPLSPDELFEKLNGMLRNHGGYIIDKQDLTTLLGISIWTEVIDRKLALYYLAKRQ
jgi:DNA polymerase III sliding clamp (beta) subunit (PCNA family)